MASSASGLTYVLDENWASIPALLKQARAVASDRTTTLKALDIPVGALDPDVLKQLGKLDRPVLLTRDSSMLGSVVQRGAWREAGVNLFLFGKRWGQLPLGELVRRMVFLWPSIVDQAEASAPGVAWRVNLTMPSVPANSFKLVTGQHAGG